MVDARHATDDGTVSHDVESDQLVVVPRVLFVGGGGLVDPQNRADELLGGGAVVDALEEGDGMGVHPAELAHGQRLPMPGRGLGNLEGERRPRHEASVGVVGVQLELERAFQAVRLDEATDAQLRFGADRRAGVTGGGHVSHPRRRPAHGGHRRAR